MYQILFAMHAIRRILKLCYIIENANAYGGIHTHDRYKPYQRLQNCWAAETNSSCGNVIVPYMAKLILNH